MDALNLRVCLHGAGHKPKIGVLTTSFSFNLKATNEKITRLVELKNLGMIPAICRFKKCPGFEVRPAEYLIEGTKSVQLTLVFKATSLGKLKIIIFSIISASLVFTYVEMCQY